MPDKTVLVADDNRLIRMLVTTALRPLDINVVEVEDGEQALAAVRSDKPDLLLLDVVMPNMDGFSVLEQIHSMPEADRCPVVMLTTASQQADIDHAVVDGAAGYIVKPFETSDLRNTVAGLLGIHP